MCVCNVSQLMCLVLCTMCWLGSDVRCAAVMALQKKNFQHTEDLSEKQLRYYKERYLCFPNQYRLCEFSDGLLEGFFSLF